MNPLKEDSYKDAIFISTHKFVGGVQCPGILILKKNLIKNKAPFQPGKTEISNNFKLLTFKNFNVFKVVELSFMFLPIAQITRKMLKKEKWEEHLISLELFDLRWFSN